MANKFFISCFFIGWSFLVLGFIYLRNNKTFNARANFLSDSVDVNILKDNIENVGEFFQNKLNQESDDAINGITWGLCNPFESPVCIERAGIPYLNMTMFILGCSLNEKTHKLLLTVFMEPDPPPLPVTFGHLHAVQSDNWSHARVIVKINWVDFKCDPPVKRASAISTFECKPNAPHELLETFTGQKVEVYVWARNETLSSQVPMKLTLCRRDPIKKSVALCLPYLPIAGPDWSTYMRQYIEYHKLVGVDSITMFDHSNKYEHLKEEYYPNDNSVVRVQWPPLSSRPDKVITTLKYGNLDTVRECYDQTLITTYYMVNTNYAWAMILDSDEYFWDEDFTKIGNNSNKTSLFKRIDDVGKKHSCVGLQTVVLFSNKTKYRPYGDQSGIVIEDNDWICPLSSYLKVVCRPNEVYGMEVHVAKAKRGRKDNQKLRNLHIKNIWMTRVEPDFSKCNNTDKYYKPFSERLRKILSH